MPVISNTSPLLNLAIIDHLFLLPQQFGQVLIPQAVLAELKVDQDLPGSSVLRAALNEGWLIPQSVGNGALVSLLRQQLHQGESEAIALAIEVSAERILLDEKEARQSARALGLVITGILGILHERLARRHRRFYESCHRALTTGSKFLDRTCSAQPAFARKW
jgi:predicted nucleic acid-binding protein